MHNSCTDLSRRVVFYYIYSDCVVRTEYFDVLRDVLASTGAEAVG